MNQIQKALKKLSLKNQLAVLAMMKALRSDYRSVSGVKKMRGFESMFRVRVGQYRLIFEVLFNGGILFHRLRKRDENTYKNI